MTRKKCSVAVAMAVIVILVLILSASSVFAKSAQLPADAMFPVDGSGWTMFHGEVKDGGHVIFTGVNACGELHTQLKAEKGTVVPNDGDAVIVAFAVHVWGRDHSGVRVNYHETMDMLIISWNGRVFILALPPMPSFP